jgi:hypothetical protein
MNYDNNIRDGMVSQILSNTNTNMNLLDMSYNTVRNYATGTKVLDFPETNNVLRLPRDFDEYCPQTIVIHLNQSQNVNLSDTEYVNAVCNLFNNIRIIMLISGNPVLHFPFSLLHELTPAVKYGNKIFLSFPFKQFFDKIDMNILRYSNIDFYIEHSHDIINYSHRFSLISKVYIHEETQRHHINNNEYNGRQFIQQIGSLYITVPYNSSINKRSFHFHTSLLFGQTKGFLIQGNISELIAIRFYINNILRFDYDPYLISTACIKVSDNLIYMPFNEITNFLDKNISAFAGSINLSQLQTSSMFLQFSNDQTKFMVHNIYSNYFCHRDGVGALYLDGRPVFINLPANFLPLVEPLNNSPTLLDMSGNYVLHNNYNTGISNSTETGSVSSNTEETITDEEPSYFIPTGQQICQLINPQRNLCNISHDEIEPGHSYMSCSNCNNHFLESSIKQWLRRRSGCSRTCPMCREIWTNYNIYLNQQNVNEMD